jgi:hypothetical protein
MKPWSKIMSYPYHHGKLDQTPFLIMCFDLGPW